MHLLSTLAAGSDDVEQAVDLGQSPGEIVILSAADTELSCLAAARARVPESFPSVRVTSLQRLGHPLSVDLYLEKVVSGARLVVLRLLGGRGYWAYGVERLAALCRERGLALAALPGDAREDPELTALSTLPETAWRRLWAYLVHGGIANAEALLRFGASLIGHDLAWAEPRPLPPASLYLPGRPAATLAEIRAGWRRRPVAALLFYRALLQSGDLAPIDALLAALDEEGLDTLALGVSSLKDEAAAAMTLSVLGEVLPDLILTATGFAVSTPGAEVPEGPLAACDCPVLQVVLAGMEEEQWRRSSRGLGPRDLAMNVALPEVDGRILARAVSFKAPAGYDPLTESWRVVHRPVPDRVRFTARLAAAWARLRRAPAAERRIAVLLANYPARDGRIGNGVGLDTPASAVAVLRAMRAAGYALDVPFGDGDELIRALAAMRADSGRRARLPLARYEAWLAGLPEPVRTGVIERWGRPGADPAIDGDAFALELLPLGRVVLGIQPPRGYHIDPAATYHSPDLVPPHHYLAFYLYLREVLGVHAVVHLGKHGNLEWLPGKALALSEACLPEVALGPLPHLYPFIVNDPGEGTQAKRRAAGVIIDHLTPPLTRAEGHGELREIEGLLDEYHLAVELDPRRARHLAREITAACGRLGLLSDLDLEDAGEDERLRRLDAHLCELKELQIRDGLHVLGSSPAGGQETDLLLALVRSPRGRDGASASLLRALAGDLGLGGWDPLAPDLARPWDGPRPPPLAGLGEEPWRTAGDTLERLERLARRLVAGEAVLEPGWAAAGAVLEEVEGRLRPALARCGPAEIAGLLRGLDGRLVPPGPSGAPSRGRPDVLPTGRNFYAVDTRAVPTPAAWALGWLSAAMIVERYLQEHGDWPRRVALSAWGTACMRTGGEDLAQALALMGCRPAWDPASGRVTGIEILPLEVLDRPRVDVTLRVSGLFRDAFPAQIELLDDAVRALAALDEPDAMNPLRAAARDETSRLVTAGLDAAAARRRATVRVFGSKPGAYGAGLQVPIDEGAWETTRDLAETFLAWSGFGYGRGLEGAEGGAALRERLGSVELVLHNQDNREHDLLDSDDYYQFEGGLIAAVRELSGRQPEAYHNDHSRPDHPRIRRLKEEIGLVVRGRAANPKWIAGAMRHGYKGAFEIAATVDYLFAFAATAGVVSDQHFEALFDAYLGDEEVRGFLARHNPAALVEIADRFAEAARRELWKPSRNSALPLLDELRGGTTAGGEGS